MGQKAPNHSLEKLPPLRERVETIQVLKNVKKNSICLVLVNFCKLDYRLLRVDFFPFLAVSKELQDIRNIYKANFWSRYFVNLT